MTSDGDLGAGDDERDAVDADDADAGLSEPPRLIPDRQWGQRFAPRSADDEPSSPSPVSPRPEPTRSPIPPPPPGAPGREAPRSTRFDNPAVIQPHPPEPETARPASVLPPEESPVGSTSPVTPWTSEPLSPTSGAASPSAPSPTPRPSEPAAPAPAAAADDEPASPMPSSADGPPERKPDRATAAIAELGQQLAATQAQVASLSAQLTTLAHRLTYDLERGAQTTSERVLRDLGSLPEQVSQQVGQHLGPAIDDLTDQVEADRARLVKAMETDVAARLGTIADAVDALPLGNVELINSIETLGADLQDRLTRFSTRMADQVQAIESLTKSELARLRDHVDELRDSLSQPTSEHETIERMAGQVERLSARPSASHEIVDAVESLIDEHLEVIRDNLDARVASLAPALAEELETVRAEALAGITSTEEALAAQVEAMEATLYERVDAALAEQIDALDGLVSDRHTQLLAAITKLTEERLEELAASAGGGEAGPDRTDEVLAAIAEMQTAAPAEDSMTSVAEELQALRRRIKVRFEAGDNAGLTAEQIEELAKQLAGLLNKT